MNHVVTRPARGGRAAPLLWSCTPQGDWYSADQTWGQRTGSPPADALGSGWRRAVPEGDQQRLVPGTHVRSFEVTFRLRGPSGELTPYRARLTPSVSAKGGPPLWTGCALPCEAIEDWSAASALLANLHRTEIMERRFRQLLDSMPQLVWLADESGSTEYYNSRVQEYDGIFQRADGNWSWQPVLHPDDAEGTKAAWETATKTRTPYVAEHRARMADGTYRWHLSRAFPVQSEDGSLHWYGTATDIHALKTAEEASRAAAEHYRLVSRATNDVIWNWDLRAHRLKWNDAVREHFGCTPEELGPSFEAWSDRVHPDEREAVTASLRQALESGKDAWTAEYRFRTRPGTYRIFLDRGYVARDARGEPTHMIGSMLDVTERRSAEDALRAADKRKDDFIAMLAHELRNPLGPIRTAVEILRSSAASNEVRERALDVIGRQSVHMARLIDDLLDTSGVVRGKLKLKWERCNLVEIVRQTAEDYRGSLEARGLSLTLTLGLPGVPVWVTGDRTRLAQAVGNILHNAAKYTGAGGRVTVALERDEPSKTVSVSITDTGIGISEDLLPRLFDPFSQEEQGIDRSRGGLGLGLALVKGIVELHGGRVQASSQGLHRGTRLSFQLPSAEEPLHEAEPPRDSAQLRGLRLLVIEDNHDAAETLQLLLTLAGHEVAIAYDGQAGIEAAEAQHPDAVLCDLGLPGGTEGYDVAQALRAHATTSEVALLAISGYGQAEDLRRSRAAGFDAHLTKPVSLETLQTALANVVHRPPMV